MLSIQLNGLSLYFIANFLASHSPLIHQLEYHLAKTTSLLPLVSLTCSSFSSAKMHYYYAYFCISEEGFSISRKNKRRVFIKIDFLPDLILGKMWKLVCGAALFLFAMFSLFLLLSSPFSFDNIVSGFGSSLSYTHCIPITRVSLVCFLTGIVLIFLSFWWICRIQHC